MTTSALAPTKIASFVFVDLVAFSKESTTTQHRMKSTFNDRLNKALVPIERSEYNLRDTGDGGFVVFSGSPESALFCALALWRYCNAADEPNLLPSSRMRIGLHIGAIKEAPDVEGRSNYVGEGINTAKRIQDFADSGQILASHNFHDAMAHLDTDYAKLFGRTDAKNDKHGRPHDLYVVSFDEAVFERLSRECGEQSSQSATSSKDKPTTHTKGEATRYKTAGLLLVAGMAAMGFMGYQGHLTRSSQTLPQDAVEHPPSSTPSLPASAPTPLAAPAVVTPAVVTPAIATSAPPEPKEVTPAVRKTQTAPKTIKADPKPPPKNSTVRCTRLIEKAATGEKLSPEEQNEMLSSCQ